MTIRSVRPTAPHHAFIPRDDLMNVPAFFQKEDAQLCWPQMHRQKEKKYEIQAVFFDELSRDAAKNGFMIFMLNAEGEILKKIQP